MVSKQCRTLPWPKLVQVRLVRLDEHLAEFLQLLRSTNFLGEKWELDDVEEFVIKFVGFVEVLLLHVMPNSAMLTVRVYRKTR